MIIFAEQRRVLCFVMGGDAIVFYSIVVYTYIFTYTIFYFSFNVFLRVSNQDEAHL